jgi:hypothetical protein
VEKDEDLFAGAQQQDATKKRNKQRTSLKKKEKKTKLRCPDEEEIST